MSTPRRPSVLLVEDHPDTRVMIEQALEGEFDVAAASGAEEALGLLGSGAFGSEVPDLFLLDIKLGEGRSGAELLSVLRDLEPTAEVPAVAVTTSASIGDREAFLKAGFDKYVSKPFRKAELMGAIRKVLSARQET